ncbi:MAG: exopolysaccharide biosynthesis protein [Terrimicrobiaceae bacterium]|nr:exopolysaccharide biosynthesis protein [Terrimicrobiaceae bacterium]
MSESHNSLSRNLEQILEDSGGGDITLEGVFRGVGDKAFGVLLAILSLPSALPLPAAGYSTPFGILLAILSLQMITFRETPALPQFAMRHKFSHERARKFFHAAIGFLRRIEWLIHPRMQWIGRPAGRAALGWLTLVMAGLMILPIPMTNTFPAMVIFLIGVGLTEDDGVFALLSFLLGLAATAFYVFVIYLLATVGLEGVLRLKDWIKGLLGL